MTDWMARFEFDSVVVAEVEVVKRTAKQAKLAKRCQASNYATTVSLGDVHPTKLAALRAIEARVRNRIAGLRRTAEECEQQLNQLLEKA